MLAHKYNWEDERTTGYKTQKSRWGKLLRLSPEDIIENMSNIMFKGILIFGIPYLLFVLIRFFMM